MPVECPNNLFIIVYWGDEWYREGTGGAWTCPLARGTTNSAARRDWGTMFAEKGTGTGTEGRLQGRGRAFPVTRQGT